MDRRAFLATLAATPCLAADEPVVRLLFAGDIMLDGHPGKVIERGGDPFAGIADALDAADLRIGNLECVVAATGERFKKKYTFRAHPRVLAMLARRFDAVTLANNHSGDFGHAAFREMLGLLDKQKLAYCGGGKDVVQARTPAILTHNGVRIAVLGYDDYQPRAFEAGPSWPGVAWAVDEQVVADIGAAKRIHKAEIVIPFMHWGWEGYPVDDRQKALGRLMIDAGADAVVGAHPHTIQDVEVYKGRPIFHSIGNCVFEGFASEATLTGWLARLTVNKNGLIEWDTAVLKMDEGGIPKLVPDVASPFGRAGSPEIRNRPFDKK